MESVLESSLPMRDETFNPLRIKRRSLADTSHHHYKVYKSPREFITVDATTAAEAFKQSGLAEAYKIERDISLYHEILARQELNGETGFVETVIALEQQQSHELVHAPREAGAPVIPNESLESMDDRFESITLDGLARKPKAEAMPEPVAVTITETIIQQTVVMEQPVIETATDFVPDATVEFIADVTDEFGEEDVSAAEALIPPAPPIEAQEIAMETAPVEQVAAPVVATPVMQEIAPVAPAEEPKALTEEEVKRLLGG